MALQPFVGPWPLFQFPNIYTVARAPGMGDQAVAKPLPTHSTTETQNKRTQYRHPFLEWDLTNNPCVWVCEYSSCLRSHGHDTIYMYIFHKQNLYDHLLYTVIYLHVLTSLIIHILSKLLLFVLFEHITLELWTFLQVFTLHITAASPDDHQGCNMKLSYCTQACAVAMPKYNNEVTY
jgi:hypothetical protein